jgi:E3 ubiquitin-protein ligase HERC2
MGKKISTIFTGEDNCACLSYNGEAFIWGYGLDGRLANSIKTNMNIPVNIEGAGNISKIACGGHHTAVINDKGELYMCGNGRNGELGRGESLESHSVMRDQFFIVIYILYRLVILAMRKF